MFKLKKKIDCLLTEEARRAIWTGGNLLRIRPTFAIYQKWYSPDSQEFSVCLPAVMTRNDWWPAPDDEYGNNVPQSARDWLQVNWPSLAKDFGVLAELCWLCRSKRESLADAMSIFWSEHIDAARVMLVALHQPDLLKPWLDGDQIVSERVDELLDDADAWEEHVTWFLTGGIRAHVPGRTLEGGESSDGSSDESASPPVGPSP